jgi:transposase
MKGAELYGQVRRAVYVEGLSRREAARRFGIDPRTVAKMLAFSVPPGYRRGRPPARPKLDPYVGVIDRILEEDKGQPAKQQHTSKRVFERLRDEHGYSGGITVVKDYVHERRQRQREMFVPLRHDPGHAQVDFGEALAVIGGAERKIHFFAMDLPHSDACLVQAYPSESSEAFCEGHRVGFEFFGGVPRSILYDNLKLAVARILGDGRRLRTRVFSQLRSYYLFADRFRRPGKGNDKGRSKGWSAYAGVVRNFVFEPVVDERSRRAATAKCLLSRSGGRGQGRRGQARAAREPLRASRGGGYLPHSSHFSVRHHEAVLELDRHLSFGSLPLNRRIFPARLHLAQHQPDEFGRRLLAGKMPADSHRLADLGVEAFDRVGGVKDFSDFRGEGEERNHLLPVAPPALRDRRIFLSPRAAGEILQPFTCDGGRFRLVDWFERCRDRSVFLPRGELHRITDQMHDAGLDHGLGKHRGDLLGKALEPVDHPDQNVLDSAVAQLAHHPQPTPSLCSIQMPRISLWPEQQTPIAMYTARLLTRPSLRIFTRSASKNTIA